VVLELSALGKLGDTIARAREQVIDILQNRNACAAWFQEADPDPPGRRQHQSPQFRRLSRRRKPPSARRRPGSGSAGDSNSEAFSKINLGTLEGRIAITHGAASALFGHAGAESIQTRRTKPGSGRMPIVAPARD
jgi:hypothetical protein